MLKVADNMTAIDWISVAKKVQSEPNLLNKIYLVELFMLRNLTELTEIEFEHIALSEDDLFALRNHFLESRTFASLSYIINDTWTDGLVFLPPETSVKWFNLLLAAESNRAKLCDRKTFNFFFFGINLFLELQTGNFLAKRFSVLCYVSLEGLIIIIHSCPRFFEYLRKEKLTGWSDNYKLVCYIAISKFLN